MIRVSKHTVDEHYVARIGSTNRHGESEQENSIAIPIHNSEISHFLTPARARQLPKNGT